MVAARKDIDALGRTAEDRRLEMLDTTASLRLLTFAMAMENGMRDLAIHNGRLAMQQLAARADIFAERARIRELPDAEPVTRCPCSRRRGARDRSCYGTCACGGLGERTADIADVDCWCIDYAQVDDPGPTLDAYDVENDR